MNESLPSTPQPAAAGDSERRRLRAELEDSRRLESQARRQLQHEREQLRSTADRLARAESQLARVEEELRRGRASPAWRMTRALRRLVERRGEIPRRLASCARGLGLLARQPGQAARLRDLLLLYRSPLFDRHFYLRTHPDVALAGFAPLLHYLAVGAAEGRRPSAMFDGRFYLACVPALARAGADPLAHYLRHGAPEGRQPNALFDPGWYAAQLPAGTRTGELLEHYLRVGAVEGRDPCPLFDSSFYLERHADVAASGQNPLAHYLEFGASEGRDPHPLFDTSYYLEEHPEARAAELDPLGHFLRRGAALGYAPHPLFDLQYYLERHPEVAGSGMNPVEHYLRVGASRGLDPHPLFDTSYYLETHPDAVASGLNPLEHYLLLGAARGCNPNPLFDTRWYGDHYPEAGTEGMNPLEHYVRLGWRRGYDPGPLFSSTLYFEENTDLPRHGLDPLAHFLGGLSEGADPLDAGFVYRCWLRTAESAEVLESAPAEASGEPLPTVSLLLPITESTDAGALERTVLSLTRQQHQGWQVLAATTPECPAAALDTLERLSHADPRIEVLRTGCSNRPALLAEALAASQAEVVGVIVPGDALDERALALMAAELAAPTRAALVYADEDRQDPAGLRCGPHFKGSFDRARLLKGRELGRPWLADRAAAVQAGGFRESPSDSPEHDLVRRLVERVEDQRVRHLARVLCHRSSAAPPTAGWTGEERAAARRQAFAAMRQPHPRPRSRPAAGAPRTQAREPQLAPYATLDNWARAREVMEGPRRRPAPREWRPGISVVILTLDRYELIAPLVDQLVAAREALASRVELQVVLGDTGSSDPRVWAKYESVSGAVSVVRGLGYHFSRCNNLLFAEQVALDKTLFLNNDVSFSDAARSLSALASALEAADDLGIVGALLLYPDGRVQHAGVELFRSGPLSGMCYHPHQGEPPEALPAIRPGCDVPAVTGACLMIRSALFQQLGGFDEAYRTEVQDVALCLAARRIGYRCRLVSAGRIEHHENATRPKGSQDALDRQRLVRRFSSFVEAQPW